MTTAEIPWATLAVVAFLATISILAKLIPPRRPEPVDIYLKLRGQALKASRAQLGLLPGSSKTDPWGLVMDWNIRRNKVTVVAIVDGSASIYTSAGGGMIGGGQSSESVRQAAKRAVEAAAEVLPQARHVTKFPLPAGNEVQFFIMTDSGVFAANAQKDALRDGTSSLSRLGNAMQQVISLYEMQ